AQLAHRGCPIVGDARYGARTRLEDERGGGAAIALVAWSLAFRHPVRPDDEVRIEVPDALDPVPGWLGVSER
ncbi:MAG TPA: RNA pseudouridine synthase, partial [bacterium]|nr:RNA pseudouridine synthase [bacterium]